MDINILLKKVEELHYWDARVKAFSCNYFADEVVLSYEYDIEHDVYYIFRQCYKIEICHGVYMPKDKSVKDMTKNEIPYFMQNVSFESDEIDGFLLTHCKILMPPMNVDIWFKDFKITKKTNIGK